MKAIRCNIMKHNGEDSSNHGISSRYNDVLVIVPDGYIDVTGDEENLVKLDSITFGGRTSYYLEPVKEPEHLGWMYGGTVVYTSDSRFPADYPLRLHDRQETPRQYEILSH